jgi:DNA segregation ATPase FtsK/SpoIIIE, S-DNA-T family
MARRKKKQENLKLPSFNINVQVRHSIFIVFILAFSVIAFLGLFDLSGQFGQFLSNWLSLIFGFGRWLVPIILLFWGILLIKKKSVQLKFTDYLGFFLLFISYQTLFHFFFPEKKQLYLIEEGVGGGYVGYYLSQVFVYSVGFWGGVILLTGFFLISLALVFNKPLSSIIGSGNWFIQFFSNLFKRRKINNKDESSDNILEKARNEVLSAWQAKEIFNEDIKEDLKSNDNEEEKIPVDDVVKVQEKIVWPKQNIRIDLPIELLNNNLGKAFGGDTKLNGQKIRRTLENFGINVEMAEIKVGPTVTQYAFKPAEGVKLSRITTLNNDLSLALAAHPLRIEAPIPGKSLVGVEVPNKSKAVVGLREVLEDEIFKKRKHNMMIALGKDVSGLPWIYDLTRMPHLLVAGATNSGKSVCLNTIIISLLYQNNPEDLRFIMVDPKRVELPAYNGIPHLLTPVITDVSKTINALKWCLNEMDRRYDLLNEANRKNIQSYNLGSKEKMPFIVFIIDELADFMMTAGKEMEAAVIRLAQMSRAVGIHLILATQRPSVDVITGLIKANVPARVAFSVTSLVDSKTILDMSGAEKLLGQGDMLLTTAELAKPKRIQGAFVSDEEINDIINYIKEKGGAAEYLEGVTDRQKVSGVAGVGLDGTHGDEDELFSEAKEIILKANKASTSLLQRRLSIGYGRAAKILDMLEESGIVGPSNGSKPREILISPDDQAISGVPLHDKNNSQGPSNYFNDDEGDDDSLAFEKEEEKEPEEENNNINNNMSQNDDKKIPKFLLEDDGPDDVIKTSSEVVKDIKSQEEDDDEEEKPKPRVFSDDEGMFFSR